MSSVPKRILPRRTANGDRVDTDGGGSSVDRNRAGLIVFFLAPGMIFFIVFVLMPLANSFYYSMFDWDGMAAPTDFVQFGNYDRLLNHGFFQTAVQNSLALIAASLVVQLPMALGLALIVGRGNLRGRSIFRNILFIPFVFSEILSAFIWMYIFNPQTGAANTILDSIVPGFENIQWFSSTRELALVSIFIVLTWKFFGLHMILYMAALQGVPKDLEDAARIDGATEFRVLRHITLPMIGPTVRLTVYLSILGSFQQFVLVWILSRGGPANSGHLMATYLYKYGINSVRLGYGSAVAVVLFSVTFIFSILYQRFVMNRDYQRES